MIRKLIRRLVVAALIVTGVAAVARYAARRSNSIRQAEAEAARLLRYEKGKLKGEIYEATGGRPDPNASDSVIEDRIRSDLGPLERRLDIPSVHVMVYEHIAQLVGVVGSEADRAEIERYVSDISGVDGVESHIHIGIGPGDSTPSQGKAIKAPTQAYKSIVGAAEKASGLPLDRSEGLARLILSKFFERIPEGEREQAIGHLPHDVVALLEPPRRAGVTKDLTSVDQITAGVSLITELDEKAARAVALGVLGATRAVVVDEADDIAAVLPRDLRQTWESLGGGPPAKAKDKSKTAGAVDPGADPKGAKGKKRGAGASSANAKAPGAEASSTKP